MELVDVDALTAQTPEAEFAVPPDRCGAEVDMSRLAVWRRKVSTLGVDQYLREVLEYLPHHLFGVARPVNGSGVDPVDSSFESAAYGSHGGLVVHLS
jgi:hypothetical protein